MDFYQRGPTTLHDLHPDRRGHARALLVKHAAQRPAALLLPMLSSEMDRPALAGIRDGLRKADFLNEIVVALTAKDETELRRCQRFFRDLPSKVSVLWCEGPAVNEALASLADRGFDLRGFSGKGLAVWLGLGLASEDNYAVALHDADIDNYDPKILHRLLLPIVVPEMDFFFAKGYYARLTDERMYGRVTRLFLWPFLDALDISLPQRSPMLRYLRSFRYPLSGEMAMTGDLARNIRIPTDWGLEMGILGEVHRAAAMKRICQVDLGTYSHKHSPVGTRRDEGLQRMALDITASVYRLLAAMEGQRITTDLLTTLQVAYRREAQDAIRHYAMDSLANDLAYDRHDEELIVEALEPVLRDAGELFMQQPNKDLIGEWLRALSADPDAPRRMRPPPNVGDKLLDAARADSA
ncbi:MAG TPA: glucosyl-3-phosphoglycerate synthase [Candidatus Thermoplasmatota archaeon]|nr:glucosyl-3-phosphoglycerate synthase [Candidatus Thermoplasmatota archaeon]